MSLLPKAVAIAKDMVVAMQFGATQTLDIYLMAFVLIGVPVSIVVVAMQTTLIPALADKDASGSAGLLGGAVKLATGLLALALPIWLVLLPVALATLYPQSEPDTRQALLMACLWLIPYYFINGINWLLYGALQARKAFWPNALLPGLFPLAIMVAVWWMPGADIRSLLIGTVIGSLLEFAVLYRVLKRRRLLRLRDTAGSGLLPVVRLATPLMAGGIIAAFAPVIEQLIAFRLGPGAVSLLSFGGKVPAALNGLLVTAVGIVVLPHFAELIVRRDWGQCRMLHLRLSGIALGGGVLIAAIGMALAVSIIELLFERGAFTSADTQNAAAIMRAYLLQLPFLLLAIVSMRALVALGKTLTLTWITTGQLLLGASLAYVLSAEHGVVGVALGTSVAAMVGAVLFAMTAWHQLNSQLRNPAA
ncbi:MAG: lipid II flippase MurJ [Pseudomonadota bacterium]